MNLIRLMTASVVSKEAAKEASKVLKDMVVEAKTHGPTPTGR